MDLSDGLCQAKDRDDVPFAFHFSLSRIYCLVRNYTSWLPSLNNTNRSILQKNTVVAEIQYLWLLWIKGNQFLLYMLAPR